MIAGPTLTLSLMALGAILGVFWYSSRSGDLMDTVLVGGFLGSLVGAAIGLALSGIFDLPNWSH